MKEKNEVVCANIKYLGRFWGEKSCLGFSRMKVGPSLECFEREERLS